MTPEQELDRLERMLRMFNEAVLRDSRETRKRTAKWKVYLAAHREHELAELTSTENPEDPEAINTLRTAKATLQRAWDELKAATRVTR